MCVGLHPFNRSIAAFTLPPRLFPPVPLPPPSYYVSLLFLTRKPPDEENSIPLILFPSRILFTYLLLHGYAVPYSYFVHLHFLHGPPLFPPLPLYPSCLCFHFFCLWSFFSLLIPLRRLCPCFLQLHLFPLFSSSFVLIVTYLLRHCLHYFLYIK